MRLLPYALLAACLPCFSYCQSQSTPFLDALKTQSASSALQHSLTISGTAEWRAGSVDESGPATLVARVDGSFDTDLGLPTAKRKTSFGSLSSRTCHRQDQAGNEVAVTSGNCYTPLAWFSPSLLPLFLSSPALLITDGGDQTENGATKHVVIVNQPGYARRVEEQALLSSLSVKVFYDPATLLPSWLEYSLHADGDDSRLIPVQVFFTDYRPVAGIQVPFRIDRYVNRSLELTISADSVSVQ